MLDKEVVHASVIVDGGCSSKDSLADFLLHMRTCCMRGLEVASLDGEAKVSKRTGEVTNAVPGFVLSSTAISELVHHLGVVV